MKKIVIGILAHVDAGKTTLSESMLYLSGQIRKLGRVDHKDAFLDYNSLERDRGITIFSKQALISYKDIEFTLIDTPGHSDFSAEMERTLQILDYAIVVINGMDGIQSHSETIWKLLDHYKVPTFLFINKMDLTPYSKDELFSSIHTHLSENCVMFDDENIYENIALCDEFVLEEFLETNIISQDTISKLIQNRKVYPCYFGSALKQTGVLEFLDALSLYTLQPDYPDIMGAKVFKITHDENNHPLAHVKITGGSLNVKEVINEEKIDQIRVYSGLKYDLVQSISAGSICALKGLNSLKVGDVLGYEKEMVSPLLSSYMNYRVLFDPQCDMNTMMKNLEQLSKEDPTLQLRYDEQSKEIRIQLMGDIQIEVFKHMFYERFKEHINFDQGKILYKETILDTVEGVGHFEPLRHYAEVHLLLEPLPLGSGLVFKCDVKEDQLSKNWQRLIMTHLNEKQHIGVLTGSPITDMRISLIAGKAHIKHTEGGDFRQATYRALRHGLARANSQLLEPYYKFELHIPSSSLSRALYDIEEMKGTVVLPDDMSSDMLVLNGYAPISQMQNYQSTVISYTKGKGKIICQLDGYRPCLNQDDVVEEMGYDALSDLDNPCGSVFCTHGAGFYVGVEDVEKYMHIPYRSFKERESHYHYHYSSNLSEDDELEAIFEKTYGKIERKTASQLGYHAPEKKDTQVEIKQQKPTCLLVDGYNVIHAWDELRELSKDNLEGARLRLMDMMCNYQGYKKCELILVFDAYKVKGNIGTDYPYHNIHVVYTKEAQTADMYIERTTHELAKNYHVVVATSDALEQLITYGAGATRMSSRELKIDLEYINNEGLKEYRRKQKVVKNTLLEDIKNYGKEDE